jgi:mannosyltransferase
MMRNVSKRLEAVPDLWWIVGMTWVGFALRLYGLGVQSLWYDEAYSWLNIAATDFWTGLRISLANFVHPPLYYILSRPFTLLGDSEWVLRLPAVVTGTLALPAIYLLGKHIAGRRLGLMAALLLALNPFHVWFSREVRNYSLAMLFTLLVVYFFLRLLRGKRAWSWFTLASAMAFVSHYFCLLLPLAQFGYFLLNFRRRHRLFRRWVLSMAIAFLPMLVWLIALFAQEEKMIGIAWIPTPKPWSILVTLWNFSLVTIGHGTVLAAIALPVFALALALGLLPSRYRQWLLLWLFAPLVSVTIISWALGRNIYVDRYFIVCLPAYLLLLALGALRPSRRWMRVGLGAALCIASIAGTARLFVDPHLSKEDWRSATAILEASRQPHDLVVLRNAEDIIPVTYYYRDELAPWTFLHPRPEADPWAAIVDEFAPQRLWLVYVNPIGSNHLLTKGLPFDVHTESDPATIAWLAAHGKAVAGEWPYAGLTVLLVEPEE